MSASEHIGVRWTGQYRAGTSRHLCKSLFELGGNHVLCEISFLGERGGSCRRSRSRRFIRARRIRRPGSSSLKRKPNRRCGSGSRADKPEQPTTRSLRQHLRPAAKPTTAPMLPPPATRIPRQRRRRRLLPMPPPRHQARFDKPPGDTNAPDEGRRSPRQAGSTCCCGRASGIIRRQRFDGECQPAANRRGRVWR